ncbi:hypothetical protein AMECASPLE_039058 [Ameca splendens]|uniref:Uncharacterized protein n=1 Tax=Ameca splendens TaxID=208324 RepID=A0ABV0XLD6_9TELE
MEMLAKRTEWSRVGPNRASGKGALVETPRLPSPQTSPPAPPGGAQGIARPTGKPSPSSVSWATLRRKLISAACIRDLRSFSHDPKFMAIGEGRNIDQPVNLLFGSALSSPQRTGTASSLMRQLHRSVCQSPAPFSPHL